MATLPTGLQVRFVVQPNVVMELVWALFVPDDEIEAEFPARSERFVAAPDLPARIRSFWADGDACYTEVFVVAQRGGVFFEKDPGRLWAGLAAGAAMAPGFERLASETPEDQVRFRGRLARLQEEPDLRQRWLSLLRDTWNAVEPGWRDHGRGVAEERAWELRARLPEAGTYSDLVPLVGECDFNGRLPQLVAEAGAAGQPAVLVPTWLGRKGFMVSLADCVVWAPPNPSRPAGPSAEVRDRARRYKAMGDPTRLAIFEAAARRPRTVGELARELGVSQPTVSNHVRILRDAALLDQETGGGRQLRVNLATFDQFLQESRRSVAGAAP
jgi:hypothetical protein